MLVALTNSPRNYAWGSTTVFSEALGYIPSGEPEAELWFGAHSGSPAVIADPTLTGGYRTLDEWIAAHPTVALGPYASQGRLPFLFKLLAAATPLSLQAHPSPQRAVEGFERENGLNIPVDAPHRNYKDPHHKPEMVYALSDTFEVLCGFRAVEDARKLFASLGDGQTQKMLTPLKEKLDTDGLEGVVEWLLRCKPAAVIEAVVNATVGAAVGEEAPTTGVEPNNSHEIAYEREWATVRLLATLYPGDPGIVLSLLLNRVSVKRGEVLYLPAGNIHAYLEGFAVEVMASSDNVLRGGLTPKHIDVDELLEVLDFRPLPLPYVKPEKPAPGVEVYRPDVPDFVLVRMEVGNEVPSASFRSEGPAIVVCMSGTVSVEGSQSSMVLNVGDCVFVTPDEVTLTVSGSGVIFAATTNNLPHDQTFL